MTCGSLTPCQQLQDNRLPGTARYSAVAFSIGSKAYIGFGYDGQHRNNLWEFNPGEGK